VTPSRTAIERAFELAQSGRFSSATQLRQAVSAEGYSAAQITGPALMRQLRDLIGAAKTGARPVVSADTHKPEIELHEGDPTAEASSIHRGISRRLLRPDHG
jgi:hypothetical protein